MNAENTGCQAPIEDLRAAALKHYDEISIYYGHWMAAIPVAINFYYDHLQANPHLLREDGEKEQSYGEFMRSNPQIPSDEQQMEQEAREKRKLHCKTLLGLTDILTGSAMAKINTEIEAALTEFGKMWYERGFKDGDARDTQNQYVIKNYERAALELQQQLAEKDKEILRVSTNSVRVVIKMEKELTAAKAEIERLSSLSVQKLDSDPVQTDSSTGLQGYDAAFITWIGEQGLEYYPKRGGWLYWGSYMSLEKLYAEWKEKVNKSTHG